MSTLVPEVPKAVGFEVLAGHTTPETALVVDDYPYGVRVRTKIRYWLETATKGAKKGQTRLVSQTMRPDTGRWNAAKGSTYADWGWMYRDHRTGHVRWCSLSAYDMVKGIVKLKVLGVWGQIDAETRFDLIGLAAHVRASASDYHAEWDEVVETVRTAVAAHGHPPDLYERVGSPKYRSDFDLALALVKAEEFGEYTLPPLD